MRFNGIELSCRSERVLKFCFAVALLIIIYILSSPTPIRCPATATGVPNTKSRSTKGAQKASKSQKSDNSTHFLHMPYPNDIRVHSSGIWSGKDTAKYHRKHYGFKQQSRLLQFFKREGASSVVDLGGGSGLHAQTLIDSGIFASCYDGNPDSQAVSNGTCATVDLTKPLHLAKHDWVLSLSVGRQIPPKFEDIFVQNIDAVNRKGVVIYWGDGKPVIGQLEKSVRNNSQVVAKFVSFGWYVHDKTASKFLSGRIVKAEQKHYSLQVFRKQEQVRVKLNSTVDTINLVVVSCGVAKLEEALTLIKSAILFSRHKPLHVFAFADNKTLPMFLKQLETLHRESRQIHLNFQFEVRLASFPPSMDFKTPWSEMFAPCSLQRLFLPSVLPYVDSVIYADADTLFLSNVQDLWDLFKGMNSTQFIAAAELTQDPSQSWFIKKGFPHYGKTGLNCGFALMNLTKMRNIGFEDMIFKVRAEYEQLRPNTTGDQFLQNILYSFHPEFVKVLPCRWNLRRMHCHCQMAGECGCPSALADGVAVIHGTKNAFTDKIRLPLFRHIYELFKTYDLQSDSLLLLLDKLRRQFDMEENRCLFKSSKSFYKSFQRYLISSLNGTF